MTNEPPPGGKLSVAGNASPSHERRASQRLTFAVTSMTTSTLQSCPAWKELTAHCETIKPLHLRGLFADDAQRGAKLALDAVGIYFDYSKNRFNDQTVRLLIRLADESSLAK